MFPWGPPCAVKYNNTVTAPVGEHERLKKYYLPESGQKRGGSKMSDKEMIKLNIDGVDVEVEKGSTVLTAARKANIDIPTLCFLKEINASRRLQDVYCRNRR